MELSAKLLRAYRCNALRKRVWYRALDARARCVYDFYRALCEEEGLRPLSYTRVRELAGDLHDGGFMDLQGGGGVGVSGVSLSDMTRILQGLEGRENPTNVG